MNQIPFATFEVDVDEIVDFGEISIGHRRMVPIIGGTVNGSIGKGTILPGTDWQWLHADGTISLDAHYSISLQTGELVEGNGNVYFRTSIRLTTSEKRPDINQRMFTSVGTRLDNKVILQLFPVD
jgi:hypothetical protein